jgi:acetyl-CoA carboxylase beta subunit
MVLARRLEKLEATARLHAKPKIDLSRLTDAQLSFLLDAQDPETGIGLSAAFASLSDEEVAAFEAAIGWPVEKLQT